MQKEQRRPALVVFLSSGSLLLEGVANRLRERADRVQLELLDPRMPDALSRLDHLRPALVILDAADPWVIEKCPLTRLLSDLPGTRIIELDSQAQQARVVTSELHAARDVSDLADVIDGHLPA